MKTIYIAFFFLLLFKPGFAQTIPFDSLYLGQTPPGNTPKLFQLPIGIGTRPIERIAISSDNKEFFYSEIDGYPPHVQRIKCFNYLNDKWQGPFVVFDVYMAPALSVNDSIIFMQKNLNGTAASACTYYSTKTNTGWSIPGRLLSANLATHYFQETNLKNYYLSTTFPGTSLRDISILLINGTDTIIKNLGPPISTRSNEGDFFIARDESYIIHARSTPPMAGDLYISYKKADGTWTNSKTLGSKINLPNPSWEYGPFVTRDNKFLFFSRGEIAMPSYSTYWVKIDNVIDSLKYTNFVPYVRNQISTMSVQVGRLFSFSLPPETFIDDDGNKSLTYSASLADGNPLPEWLSFDQATQTFSGKSAAITTITVKVTASDQIKAAASCTFSLSVTSEHMKELR